MFVSNAKSSILQVTSWEASLLVETRLDACTHSRICSCAHASPSQKTHVRKTCFPLSPICSKVPTSSRIFFPFFFFHLAKKSFFFLVGLFACHAGIPNNNNTLHAISFSANPSPGNPKRYLFSHTLFLSGMSLTSGKLNQEKQKRPDVLKHLVRMRRQSGSGSARWHSKKKTSAATTQKKQLKTRSNVSQQTQATREPPSRPLREWRDFAIYRQAPQALSFLPSRDAIADLETPWILSLSLSLTHARTRCLPLTWPPFVRCICDTFNPKASHPPCTATWCSHPLVRSSPVIRTASW